jgi:hypothetical protein
VTDHGAPLIHALAAAKSLKAKSLNANPTEDHEVILALELSLAKQRIRMLEETVLAQAADISRILRLIGALR